MRNVCKVLSWVSNSTAAALLALAVLAIPSAARADTPPGGNAQVLCFTCTDTCPARAAGTLGCLQDANYCKGVSCFCNCDPVSGSATECECNNEPPAVQ
jgi:hypothetical protein